MTEEFILEDDVSEDSSNRRPFLIAAGALAIVGILAIGCIAIALTRRGSSGNVQEIAAIETQNAIIAVTNEAVTRTIEAMQTEAARPTDTPVFTPTSTATPIPTNTPRPTDTPVVQQAEEETPDLSGTTFFAGAIGDATPTPIGALGSGATDSSLPQTGIGTWAASVAALFLLGVLVVARRLRSS